MSTATDPPSPPPRPGPVYDDAMKILAADDLDALLSVLGVHVRGARPLNVELAGPLRVDVLADTAVGLVHVEFVKDGDPDLDVRMVEYWARIQRREKRRDLLQFLLVLGDGVPVPAGCLDEDGVPVRTWTVVRVADLDPARLLQHPTTSALAALAWGSPEQRRAMLAAAAHSIATTSPDRARTLLQAAATLSSIVLPRRTIATTLRGNDMPILIRDTPLAREVFEEGRQEGRQLGRREGREQGREQGREEGREQGREEGREQGREQGRHETALQLTRLLLRQRFGEHSALESTAAALLALPDEERLAVIAAAASIDALTT